MNPKSVTEIICKYLQVFLRVLFSLELSSNGEDMQLIYRPLAGNYIACPSSHLLRLFMSSSLSYHVIFRVLSCHISCPFMSSSLSYHVIFNVLLCHLHCPITSFPMSFHVIFPILSRHLLSTFLSTFWASFLLFSPAMHSLPLASLTESRIAIVTMQTYLQTVL